MTASPPADFPVPDGTVPGGADPGRAHQDGSRRFVVGVPQPRAFDARRSRFVNLMKLVLPLVAGALVAVVIVWPQLRDNRETFRLGTAELSVTAGAGQEMTRARFQGIDNRGRPFSVTSTTVSQPGGAAVAELAQPKADIALNGDDWVAVSAETGRFDRDSKVLWLGGGVDLFHDSGYELHTASVSLDFTQGTAAGDEPVTGHGPFGEIEAAGLRVYDGGNRVVFPGKARLVLHPAGPGRS